MARLLNAHKFLKILQSTLQQLYEHAINQTKLDDLCVEKMVDIAESSSTTVEASSVEEPKKPRKRKRTESQVYEIKNDLGSNYDTGLSYFSVCRVIKRLNTLVIPSHDDAEGFVTEHLKASLNGSPEHVTEILGTSLNLANILLRNSHFQANDHMRVLGTCVSSSIEFWKICLATAEDPSDKPSNVRRISNLFEDGRLSWSTRRHFQLIV